MGATEEEPAMCEQTFTGIDISVWTYCGQTTGNITDSDCKVSLQIRMGDYGWKAINTKDYILLSDKTNKTIYMLTEELPGVFININIKL